MAIHAQLYPENLGFPFAVSPDWAVDHGRAGGVSPFCFNLQQKQPLPPVPLQHPVNQTECFDNGGSGLVLSPLKNTHHRTTVDDCGHQLTAVSQCMNAHVEKQKQEIDLYIRLQNENLRSILRNHARQQLATLLKKVELKTAIMFQNKEEELAQAAKKTMELEIFLRKLESDNQIWQRIAQENEVMAMSLNNTLDRMKEKVSNCFDNGGAEDAESCCDMMNRAELEEKAEEEISKFADFESRKKTKMVCRFCNSRNSCVIFLPCRHLCSCKDCEAVLESCPVCQSAKKASIEALIF